MIFPKPRISYRALTTVRLDFDAVGRACVAMLINSHTRQGLE